jgi:NDP-sugar pyrophosphorylase family protein
MQAVVLAGGLATRLGSLARHVPKYLLPVAGRPFAHWQLERLCDAGFREVVLCIGHHGALIREALGDGGSFGLALRYADDGPALRGTGGALRAAHALLAPSFLVTYGDSLLPFDYGAPLRDLDAHPHALGTLAVYRNLNEHDRSNVVVDGELVREYRQAGAALPIDPAVVDIDYGAMALRRDAVLELAADGPSSLGDLQLALASRGRLRALRATRCFYEIGTEAGLGRLDRALRRSPTLGVPTSPPTMPPTPRGPT